MYSTTRARVMRQPVAAALLALSLLAQEPASKLTNDDIIEMVKAKLSESLIQSQIRNSKSDFDLSTSELIRLSKAGVSESVLATMRNQGAGTGTAPRLTKSKRVKMPDGERVRLILMEDVSSAHAHQGDRVLFATAEDLKVGDIVLIPKGSQAYGTITEAKRKGMLGRGGRLSFSLDQVKAADGQNIRLRATAGREGDDKLGKTVAVAVLAGPFALLVKGKDIAAPKGTEYSAYIDESKDIAIPE